MVTLVIPVFNKVDLTRRCLQSALENSKRLQKVIVIDNGSSDQTPEALSEFKKLFENRKINFQVITNPANLGYGAACNQGLKLLDTTYVAILNNDTWLSPDWDEALMGAMARHNLDLVGPFFDEQPWVDDITDRCSKFLAANRFKFREHFVPILMFFTRDAIKKLMLPPGGIFDERFFVTYEDTDLFYRLKKIHLKYGQTSECFIWHQSMGTRADEKLLPADYELDGLNQFKAKWGFDPRAGDHSLIEKLKRKFRKKRAEKGLF